MDLADESAGPQTTEARHPSAGKNQRRNWTGPRLRPQNNRYLSAMYQSES
jgi:hypothetical protein